MSAMSPVEAAFVSEALEAIDEGCAIVNMRDGHSEYWGGDQLALKLENTEHKVEWIYKNLKCEAQEDAETGHVTHNLFKDGGCQAEWDDGFMVTHLPNVMGIRMKHAVDGSHVKFGMTMDVEDSSKYENGFYVGLFPDKKIIRGEKGKKETPAGRYEMSESMTVIVKNGAVMLKRNAEENPFDVIGDCKEEGTSMHGMIHVRERDAMGQLEHTYAIALVNSIDVNNNLLGDQGVDRLALALEVPFTKITHLDLGLNKIRCAGAARMAQVLEKRASVLTTLVLSNNEIGDEGAAALAGALSKDGCKLTKLWLEGNMIADEGATKLAEALETESCLLTRIELAWNNIEDEGAQRVMQALSNDACKITHFTIDHNKFLDKKTKKMLATILGKVPRLIDMSCGLTDDYPANEFAVGVKTWHVPEEEDDE